MSDRIKANHGGGFKGIPWKGIPWNKGKRTGLFDRKLYDHQRKINLRNQDFLFFGLL